MLYKSNFISNFRKISTNNIDELVSFHANKNRKYIQLQPGNLYTSITEATLSNVQIFRETINIGSRIKAEPADNFLPFGFVLPHTGQYKFCGNTPLTNSFIQASGGIWDVYFKENLDYVCSAFDKEYFIEGYQTLMDKEVPIEYFNSKVTQTTFALGMNYANGIKQLLEFIASRPSLVNNENISRLLCSEILDLTIKALSPSLVLPQPIKSQRNRQKKIDNVIDYICAYAQNLPDIQTLCQIGQLSERSLQYGFIERIGITPIQYLRIIRLNKARVDLKKHNKLEKTVGDIALAWGFVEFGRFAQDYKKLFHELPSKTLASYF